MRSLEPAEALRSYVAGDIAEPDVLSAFRGLQWRERSLLVSRHRDELAAIDASRSLILESLLLPLSERRG